MITDLIDRAREILAKYPPDWKWQIGDVLQEIRNEGMSGEEAARVVGIPYGTAHNLWRTAMKYPENTWNRGLQSWSIYLEFASQDDRDVLITSRKWTSKEARSLIQTRREARNLSRPKIGPGRGGSLLLSAEESIRRFVHHAGQASDRERESCSPFWAGHLETLTRLVYQAMDISLNTDISDAEINKVLTTWQKEGKE